MAMAKSMVLTYGNKNICFDLDRGNLLGELRPRRDYNGVGKAEIDCAIKNPVGLKENIYQIARKKIKSPGDYVCIVVSDQTRSTGVEQYLEMLIDSLNREGIADEKIVLQFANGMHRPPTREEQKEKLGRRIYARFQGRIFVHDASDETSMVDVGTTTRDNRVRINRIVADARVKILTGSVMYHYFAGFGGGRKSILAGVSSADTIARNHSLTINPNENRIRDSVEIGRLKGNPVAEDMEEAAALTGIDYIINTVMAEDNTIAAIAAGDFRKAFYHLTVIAENIFGNFIERKADLVIATAGNRQTWVQSHKALFNASLAVHEQGVILLLAECSEGIGSERLEHWLKLGSMQDLFEELRKNPEVNGQTAYSTLCRGHRTILVSELSREKIALLRMTPAKDINEALKMAFRRLDDNFSYYFMPEACYTVPLAGKVEKGIFL